ncbi:MAG TPA: RNA-binding domain-containing protein, partial [Anaerolineales bacterium]
MYSVIPDSSSEVQALISCGISSTLHWFPEDVPVSFLASTLVAMANSHGGTIILGVSPRFGELLGVSDLQAVQEKVFQAAVLAEPTLVLPMARQVSARSARVKKSVNLILVSVPPGLPHVYSFDGRYFGRDGSHTSPLSARSLYKLLDKRGFIQFETRLVSDASLSDLDSDSVLAYAHSVGNVSANDLGKAYDFLVKRGCLKRLEGDLHLTYAALLLFGHSPQQWLPNATILAGRFPGAGMSDIYIKRDINGNLPNQLNQVEEFIL